MKNNNKETFKIDKDNAELKVHLNMNDNRITNLASLPDL